VRRITWGLALLVVALSGRAAAEVKSIAVRAGGVY
jgi:hypothetical protein